MDKVVILAGGKGKRMGADSPKVLCEVGGRPIIEWILAGAKSVCEKPVAVVGFKGEQVKERMGDRLDYVLQEEQLGTGHAVQCAASFLRESGCERVVVLPGDHPLVSKKTIEDLVETQRRTGAKVVLASVKVPNFEGQFEGFGSFGKVLRDPSSDQVCGIVEVKDATPEQKEIKELNTSYYCFDAGWLLGNIGKLKNDNAAGELYLTDMIGIAVGQGEKVVGCEMDDWKQALGANTREQLEIIEQVLEK